MNDWHYDKQRMTDVKSGSWNTAYLWIVPAKVEGTWKFNDGKLKLEQKYQMVSGSMNTGKKTMTFTKGKLRGDSLSFTCGDVRYKCRVDENILKGTAEKNGKITAWEAVK